MSPADRTPPEFVDFVRDIGVRSFDYFASRVTDERSPFRKLASIWSELEAEQKTRFFDQLISGAQTLAASAVVTKLTRRSPADEEAEAAPAKKQKKAKKAGAAARQARSSGGEIANVKEKKKDKKKADDKKGKNKDKKGKKKKNKKGDDAAIPSAS